MILKKWLYGLPMPLYFLLLVLLLYLLPGLWLSVCRAQGSTPPGTALATGQPVPDVFIPEILNHTNSSAKLSDYRGKLVLLDFFASWCLDSRRPLPLLDSLQHAYGDRLQVLLVNATSAQDPLPQIKALLQSTPHLPVVAGDTTLIKLFPHHAVPHFAWITPEGTVGAITRAERVTAANIQQALEHGRMPVSLLPDRDLSVPLFTGGALPETSLVHASFLVRGKIDDGPGRTVLRHEGDTLTGMTLANLSVLELFQAAKRQLYPALGSRGLLLAGVDSAELFQESSGLPPTEWKATRTYTYEQSRRAAQPEPLFLTLLQDLNTHTGYQALFEPRKIDCFLLVRHGNTGRYKSKGGKPANRLFHPRAPSMQNKPLEVFIARLNSNNTLPRLVLDHTGYDGAADITLPSGFTDLATLRRELRAQGLDLIPRRRKVPVLVLRKLTQPTDL